MFSAPSTAAFHHHCPLGRRRPTAARSRPAGTARSTPASSGRYGGSRPGGGRWGRPQALGASPVIAMSVRVGAVVLTSLSSSILLRRYFVLRYVVNALRTISAPLCGGTFVRCREAARCERRARDILLDLA